MGKQGHHKKNLKKEKNKVKFKVGKSLPKGQNITDTSFKVKKVVIKEQLKTGGLEPVTKRNLNLKETLSRLQHYNTNVKIENLSGLKEILTNNQDLLSGNLQTVLEKLAELISDREAVVRKEAISQLANLIGQVPSSRLAPFVCLLCSHLGAALSHINKDIQLDALLLLDGILSRHSVAALILSTAPPSPSLSHPFDLILQGLINQISEHRETSSKASGWERKLSVNPASKLGDIHRRTKVLTQLFSLMKAALDMRRKSCSKDVLNEGPKCILWKDIADSGYVSCYGLSYGSIQGLALPRTLTSSFSVPPSISSSEPLGECDKLKVIVSSLVPILVESWKEVAPAKDTSSDNMLTLEAADLLKIMLDLFMILLEALMLYDKESAEASDLVQWFRTSYSQPIFDLLMPIYPFQSSGAKGRSKKAGKRKSSEWVIESSERNKHRSIFKGDEDAENERTPAECFQTSLLLAQFYCSLELKPAAVKRQGKKLSSRQQNLTKILAFMIRSLEDSKTCHNHGKQISDLLWNFVSCRKTSYGNSGNHIAKLDDIKYLIEAVITCCESSCPHVKNSAAFNCPFFKLLCNILKDSQLVELQRLSSFERWVERLPGILDFPCPKAMEILSQIAQRCNVAVFHSMIKSILPKLFLYLKTSPDITGNEDNLKRALTLLHWVRNWNKEELNSLQEIVIMYPQLTSSLAELFRVRKEYLGEESEFNILTETVNW
ncbi:testis-expressed protein 10 [Ischnura elegans]|uniref:testis-expressed protein 10 n=1 Tax=Ischnura elegans TaxID=197161 RepID=UPI001ED8B72A|nr:testis-expressed protein 10 [Ischnura elegans]